MFQFPGFASRAYVFSARYPRKAGGFPHSEIPGSELVCQLTGAYRRLPRPSSPLIAKASTMCACLLDHTTPKSLQRMTALRPAKPNEKTAAAATHGVAVRTLEELCNTCNGTRVAPHSGTRANGICRCDNNCKFALARAFDYPGCKRAAPAKASRRPLSK